MLKDIADQEKEHHDFWYSVTQKEVKPSRWKIFKFTLISRILGFTFAVKLMENGEENAQERYSRISEYVPEAEKITREEEIHEEKLIDLLDEERLRYTGSMVLGLNDALVELTGTLAGLTFALQNTRLIALAGLITGIAASLSMGASDYLSKKADEQTEEALKSSIYTGLSYIITVFLLVAPYFLMKNYYFSLLTTLGVAILVILFFNYYISIAKDLNFKERFSEMAFLSLGVAALSFGIGILLRTWLGVEV